MAFSLLDVTRPYVELCDGEVADKVLVPAEYFEYVVGRLTQLVSPTRRLVSHQLDHFIRQGSEWYPECVVHLGNTKSQGQYIGDYRYQQQS